MEEKQEKTSLETPRVGQTQQAEVQPEPEKAVVSEKLAKKNIRQGPDGKFISTRLSSNATRDEVMLHSLFEIVKKGKDEPKMASAAVQAAKEIWNRARGEAAKSELDREAMTQQEQKIKVVIIPRPELMNPEPKKFEEPKPKKPSAQFLAKYGDGTKTIEAEIISTNPPALPRYEEP